jgi:hypothetical protein
MDRGWCADRGRFDPRRDTSAVLAEVLIPHPDITDRLDDLHREAWRVADPVLLELCRLRIAQLLGGDAEQAARTPRHWRPASTKPRWPSCGPGRPRVASAPGSGPAWPSASSS